MVGIAFMALCLGLLTPYAIGLILCSAAYKIIHAAKILLGLLIAFLINGNCQLFENGFLSYCAWAAISIGGIYLLCLLPRFKCAFQFLATSIISFFLALILLNNIYASVLSWFGQSFEYTLWIDIVVRIACVAISVYMTYKLFDDLIIDGIFANPIIGMLDRVISSVGYGFGVTVIATTSLNNLWSIPAFVSYIVIGVVAVLYFILDYRIISVKRRIILDDYAKQAWREKMLEDIPDDDKYDDEEYHPRTLLGKIITGDWSGSYDDDDDDYDNWD